MLKTPLNTKANERDELKNMSYKEQNEGNWQTLSQSEMSKFKSRLKTGFSLKSDFPTSQESFK